MQKNEIGCDQGTHLDTDTTTDAKLLGDEGNFSCRGNLDAKLSCKNTRQRYQALPIARSPSQKNLQTPIILTQIPHKPQKSSAPVFTTGQLFLHSCRHFFGLHLSELTIAILVNRFDILMPDRGDLVPSHSNPPQHQTGNPKNPEKTNGGKKFPAEWERNERPASEHSGKGEKRRRKVSSGAL